MPEPNAHAAGQQDLRNAPGLLQEGPLEESQQPTLVQDSADSEDGGVGRAHAEGLDSGEVVLRVDGRD